MWESGLGDPEGCFPPQGCHEEHPDEGVGKWEWKPTKALQIQLCSLAESCVPKLGTYPNFHNGFKEGDPASTLQL